MGVPRSNRCKSKASSQVTPTVRPSAGRHGCVFPAVFSGNASLDPYFFAPEYRIAIARCEFLGGLVQKNGHVGPWRYSFFPIFSHPGASFFGGRSRRLETSSLGGGFLPYFFAPEGVVATRQRIRVFGSARQRARVFGSARQRARAGRE